MEYKKNIKKLIENKYHRLLNLNEKEFMNMIPKPDIKQKEGFNNLLLVIPDKMISIEKQLRLSGFKMNVDFKKIKTKTKVPTKPYWLYFQDGKINIGKSPNDCRKNLMKNERGLTIVEGISLALQYPEIIKNHSVDLIGSSYGNECTPTIYFWKDKVMISAICSDVSDSMCGSATCLDLLTSFKINQKL